MQDTKLFSLLTAFTPQEVQRFQAFLQSVYFNKDNTIVELFEALRPLLHSRNTKTISGELVWKTMFKNKPFSATQFNKMCFELNRLATEFLQIHFFNQNEELQQVVQLQLLNKKKLTAQFQNQFAKTAAAFNTETKTEQQHHTHLQLQLALNIHQEQLQKRNEERNIPALMLALDEYYLLLKLKYWCAALHYNRSSGLQTDVWMQDELLLHLNDARFEKNQLINLYKLILQMLLNTDEQQHFKTLKQFLFTQKDIPEANRLESFMYLINYCIRQINRGDNGFYKELFTTYQYTLKAQIIATEKSISPWDFKNIVTSSLYVNELKWAENFIKTYGTRLPKAEQENAITYNLAKIYFIQKEYKKCLQQLHQIEYTDPFYQLGAKLTQAKALYELDEFDTLQDLLISFRKLINTKKLLSNQHRTNHKNFIAYLKQLLSITNKIKAKILQKEITMNEQVVDKTWLLEKVREVAGQ